MPDKTASYWNKEGNKVFCRLCPQECLISENQFGLCLSRVNKKNNLIAQSYGAVSAINVDPVEKKPLYHFHPGEKTLSFGSYGCNLKCSFCQNHSISMSIPSSDIKLSPDDAIYFAEEKNIKILSYTYNEPLVNYEWVFEMSRLAREKSMLNVLVSNGYIKEEPLKKLAQYIDAANIDLKSFDNYFYEKNCAATLEPVLKSIEILYKSKVHLEITTLLIDGENTDEKKFDGLIEFIAGLSDEIPLHLSKYFPAHKFTLPSTEKETLLKFYALASNKLKYVYLGNIDSPKHEATYCRKCGFCLIKREGYDIEIKSENPRICPECGERNNIII